MFHWTSATGPYLDLWKLLMFLVKPFLKQVNLKAFLQQVDFNSISYYIPIYENPLFFTPVVSHKVWCLFNFQKLKKIPLTSQRSTLIIYDLESMYCIYYFPIIISKLQNPQFSWKLLSYINFTSFLKDFWSAYSREFIHIFETIYYLTCSNLFLWSEYNLNNAFLWKLWVAAFIDLPNASDLVSHRIHLSKLWR